MSVILALLAAASNAVASVLQRKAAGKVPDVKALKLSLIRQLFHYPVWFAGIGAVTLSFLLQALALSGGTLAMVQPILIAELPLTLLLSSKVFGSRLGKQEWLSTLGMAGGLALLLATAAPRGGRPDLSALAWIVGIVITLGGIGLLVLAGIRGEGVRRAALLGVAAGAAFGLTAALMKAMTSAFEKGFLHGFTAWQLYLMIVIGILAMYLLENALQAGRLAASQPGFTITDPLVATLWGVVLFGETVRGGLFLLPEIVGIALIATGVVVLARSPLLSGEAGRHEEGDPGGDKETVAA